MVQVNRAAKGFAHAVRCAIGLLFGTVTILAIAAIAIILLLLLLLI